MSVNDYLFIVNNETQGIEGYSKSESYIKRTIKKKRETKPNHTFSLMKALFTVVTEAKADE